MDPDTLSDIAKGDARLSHAIILRGAVRVMQVSEIAQQLCNLPVLIRRSDIVVVAMNRNNQLHRLDPKYILTDGLQSIAQAIQ